MSETMIGYLAFGTLIGLAVGCLFYMLGGREGKWKRRFVGSLVIAGTSISASILMGKFSWYLLLAYPVLIAGMSLGYGGDTLITKFTRRLLFALGVCSAGLVYAFTFGGNAWLILVPHIGIGLWSIWLGIKNPIEAAAEEIFICAFLCLGLMMYPFMV